MPGLVKHDDSDTFPRGYQMSVLGQCYTPGFTHFNAVVWRNIPFKIHIGDAFVLHTFHLLSVRFTLEVAFVC